MRVKDRGCWTEGYVCVCRCVSGRVGGCQGMEGRNEEHAGVGGVGGEKIGHGEVFRVLGPNPKP